MLKYITGSIIDVTEGIICQQVNCRNAYGRGVSGAIARKWPAVEADYRKSFKEKSGKELFGTWRGIEVVPGRLYVCNLYTQYDYGNAYRTKIQYTDMSRLAAALKDICRKSGGRKVYVPYGIGCALGGGKWEELEKKCWVARTIRLQPCGCCKRRKGMGKRTILYTSGEGFNFSIDSDLYQAVNLTT